MIDNKEVDRIISKYGNELLKTCYIYMKDYSLAEDIVQDTLIQVIQKYDTLKDRSKEKSWIFKIAINKCKNQLRTEWFKRLIYFENEDEFNREFAEDSYKDDNIIEIINTLKTTYREVIILYYYQEMSVKEISLILGKTEANILQILKRARKKLKERLGDFDE